MKGRYMRMKKILLASILTLAVLIAFVCCADAETIASGTLSNGFTWTVDSNRCLTVSGTNELTADHGQSLIAPVVKQYSVRKVIISEGITGIGINAFGGCDSITSVTLPDSLRSIGSGSFKNCKGLTSIVIPDSVTTIMSLAFDSCTNITSVTIPANVTSIDFGAFSSMNSLTGFTVDANNSAYSVDAAGVLFNKDKTTLVAYPAGKRDTAYTVPDSVTKIEDFAFYGTSLQKVILPSGLKTIGGEAFRECGSITECVLPTGLESIGEVAFGRCYGLNGKLFIPWTVSRIGEMAFLEITVECYQNSYAAGWLSKNGCSYVTVTDIVASDTLSNGFYWTLNCFGNMDIRGSGVLDLNQFEMQTIFQNNFIESVTLSSGITSIGTYGFYYCESLKSIDLNKVTSIGYMGFTHCTNLESIDLSGIESIGMYAFSNCKKLTSISLSNKMQSLELKAFTECTGLTEVTIPYTLTSIGDRAFYGCTKVKKFTVASGNPAYCSDDAGVLYNKNKTTLIAYPAGRAGLYIIPNSVTSIGAGAFYKCRKISTLFIPQSVTSISDDAFEDNPDNKFFCAAGSYAGNWCAQKEYDVLPGAGTLSNGFTWCADFNLGLTISGTGDLITEKDELKTIINTYSTENVVISAGITSIGDEAFSNCTGLKTVTLPSGVTSIGNKAFYNCGGLTAINLPEGITGIGASAFCYCNKLTEIILPESLITVGGDAFLHCDSITSLRIPADVETFGSSSSRSTPCAKLTRYTVDPDNQYFSTDAEGVLFNKEGTRLLSYPGGREGAYTVPAGTTYIENYAFWDCTRLSSVVIPEGVKAVNGYTFSGCTMLSTAVLPYSINTINVNAFKTCKDDFKVVCIKGSYAETWCQDNNRAMQYATNGVLSNGITWALDSSNRLTISGNGTLVKNTELKTVIDAYGVENVTVAAGITSIGDYAFDKYTELKTVTLSSGVTSIGFHAFYNCSNMTSIVLPEGLTSIGGGAFNTCSSLESITLPESLLTVGDDAFLHCDSITSLHIPAALTSFGGSGSYSTPCLSLMAYTVDPGNLYYSTDAEGVLFNKEGTRLLSYPAGREGAYVIPDGTTAIESFAFWNCPGVVSVEMPDSLQTISVSAFLNCSALTAAIIPDGVTSIGSNAFKGNADGFTVTCGVGSCADKWCADNGIARIYFRNGTLSSGFTWEQDDSNALVISGTGELTVTDNELKTLVDAFSVEEVIISSGITHIGEKAFYNCAGIKEVTLPDGITGIGRMAFYHCEDLYAINMPEGITSIGGYAFAGCLKLYDFYLPDSLLTVGNDALLNCNSLPSIYIPPQVSYFGDSGFHSTPCHGSNQYIVNANNPYFDTDTNGVLYDEDMSTLLSYPAGRLGGYVIPDGVTAIDAYAFTECDNLTSIWIPSSVTAIGNYAFYKCTGLTSITIPDTVTTIGYHAFDAAGEGFTIYCHEGSYADTYAQNAGITVAYPLLGTLSNGFAWELNAGNVLTIDGTGAMTVNEGEMAALLAQHEVTGVVINEGVTAISAQTFEGCAEVGSITLPESVTSIEDYAFHGCTDMTGINVPESVVTIGAHAFDGCEGLTEVSLPYGLESIGDYAYAGCTGLEVVWDTGGLSAVSDYMFYGCTGLEYVYPSYGLLEIGDHAFANCTGMVRIDLPVTLVSIGEAAFVSTDVRKIDIPAGVTGIGDGAFVLCGSLTSINVRDTNAYYCSRNGVLFTKDMSTLICFPMGKTGAYTVPESVSVIGANAFGYCAGLTSVTLPAGLRTIEPYAFTVCTGLADIVIPRGTVTVDRLAFAGCDLHTATVPRSVTTVGTMAFEGENLVIRCGAGSAAETWAHQENITVVLFYEQSGTLSNGFTWAIEDDRITVSGTGVLMTTNDEICEIIGSRNVTEAIVTPGITGLSGGAFSNCFSLVNVTLPSGLTMIGDKAFFRDYNMANISIPDGVTSIGENAFAGCKGLTTVFIPGSVTAIGENAFSNCTDLTAFDVADTNTVFSDRGGVLYDKAGTELLLCPGGKSGNYAVPAGTASIAEGAFYLCRKLATVTIPAGVTAIPASAFSDCDKLLAVNLPDGVTTIGKDAFRFCSSLAYVNIPGSVTTIGKLAFDDCSRLAGITMPRSVTSIGDYAFDDTDEEFTVRCYTGSYAETWALQNGYNIMVLADASGTFSNGFTWTVNYDRITISGTGALDNLEEFEMTDILMDNGVACVTVGEGITRIGDLAFSECGTITNVSLPSTLTELGEFAFGFCDRLSAVDIPAGVNNIGYGAFAYCGSLTGINVAESNVCYKSVDGVLFSKNGKTLIQYPGGKGGVYDVPFGTKTIGPVAFLGSSALTGVNIAAGVIWVEEYAFGECPNLQYISFPESVISFGDGIFTECSEDLVIRCSADSNAYRWASYRRYNIEQVDHCHIFERTVPVAATIGDVGISSGMACIDCGFEEEWAGIIYPDEVLFLPGSLHTIGEEAFSGMGMQQVNIPDSISSIGPKAFADNPWLRIVVIPNSVTYIAADAFSGCSMVAFISDSTYVKNFGAANGIPVFATEECHWTNPFDDDDLQF